MRAIPVVLGLALVVACRPAGASLSEARQVIGSDDRVEMLTGAYPFSAVGRVLNEDEDCTGTLVWRDLVLTARHCVEESPGRDREHLAFKPNDVDDGIRARLGLPRRGNVAPTATARVVTKGARRGEWADDWALLVLDEPLGDRFNWLDAEAPPGAMGVSFAGFSMDFWAAHGTAGAVRACALQEPKDGIARHDCDATEGASGGPLLSRSPAPDGAALVRAVHVGAIEGENLAAAGEAIARAVTAARAESRRRIGDATPPPRAWHDPVTGQSGGDPVTPGDEDCPAGAPACLVPTSGESGTKAFTLVVSDPDWRRRGVEIHNTSLAAYYAETIGLEDQFQALWPADPDRGVRGPVLGRLRVRVGPGQGRLVTVGVMPSTWNGHAIVVCPLDGKGAFREPLACAHGGVTLKVPSHAGDDVPLPDTETFARGQDLWGCVASFTRARDRGEEIVTMGRSCPGKNLAQALVAAACRREAGSEARCRVESQCQSLPARDDRPAHCSLF